MGNLLDYFWGAVGGGGRSSRVDPLPDNAAFDVPDHVTGLTPREIHAIRDTWYAMKKDIKGIGVSLFIKLFSKYPKYKAYFKAFKDIPIMQLPNNVKLQAHATGVMYQVMCLIDTLDDPETLIAMLHKVGDNHGKHNVTEQAFWDLKDVFMELLTEQLGTKFTTERSDAWGKMLDTAITVIVTKLDEKNTT